MWFAASCSSSLFCWPVHLLSLNSRMWRKGMGSAYECYCARGALHHLHLYNDLISPLSHWLNHSIFLALHTDTGTFKYGDEVKRWTAAERAKTEKEREWVRREMVLVVVVVVVVVGGGVVVYACIRRLYVPHANIGKYASCLCETRVGMTSLSREVEWDR